MAQATEPGLLLNENGMLMGLAAGGFAAVVLTIATAMVEWHVHSFWTVLLLALGAWGWIAVQELLARYRRYKRILLEHGLLPSSR